jgi:hypothetical protein
MGFKLLHFVSFLIPKHDKYHCRSRIRRSWIRRSQSRSRIALRLRLRPNDAAPAPTPQHWQEHYDEIFYLWFFLIYQLLGPWLTHKNIFYLSFDLAEILGWICPKRGLRTCWRITLRNRKDFKKYLLCLSGDLQTVYWWKYRSWKSRETGPLKEELCTWSNFIFRYSSKLIPNTTSTVD